MQLIQPKLRWIFVIFGLNVHARMSEEFQIEMGKIKAPQKRWRVKVKKMQEQPFLKERLERSSSIPAQDPSSSVDKKEAVQSCKKMKVKKTVVSFR